MRASRYILVRHGTLRVVEYPADGVYSLLDFGTKGEAYRFLQRFARNPRAMAKLEELVNGDEDEDEEDEDEDDEYAGRSRPTHALKKNRDVLAEVAELIVDEEVGVAQEVQRTNPPTKLDKKEEPVPQEQPPTPKQEKKLTWIEFKVLDDITGNPVNWVRLVVKTPDGNQTYQTTNAEGLVRMEELEPGTCDVSCELKNPTMADVLAFKGMGVATEQATAEAEENGQQQKPGTLRIADVEQHKVKTKESLDGLAKKAGMTWKDLAKFNWGTDVPDAINKHLRADVGCRRKTADKKNYIFHDEDDPGIILIPKKWEQNGLATGGRHVIRVAPVQPPGSVFHFSV